MQDSKAGIIEKDEEENVSEIENNNVLTGKHDTENFDMIHAIENEECEMLLQTIMV